MDKEIVFVKKEYGYDIYSDSYNSFFGNGFGRLGKLFYREMFKDYAFKKSFIVSSIGLFSMIEVTEKLKELNK